VNGARFGLHPFRSPLLRIYFHLRGLFSFPLGNEMFYFPRCAYRRLVLHILFIQDGFPHSEISGSKVARHLPEAYRSQATSFIAFLSQGIHHTPLHSLLGNVKTAPITSPAYTDEAIVFFSYQHSLCRYKKSFCFVLFYEMNHKTVFTQLPTINNCVICLTLPPSPEDPSVGTEETVEWQE
jgi:hypothetical protein